jgi:hypothetical protein
MKNIIIALILIIMLSGCGIAEEQKAFNDLIIESRIKSINACIDNGGIPMVNEYGLMLECKFKEAK